MMNAVKVRVAKEADALRIRNVHVASIRGLWGRAYSAKIIRAWSGNRKPSQYKMGMASGEKMFIALVYGSTAGFSAVKKNEIKAVYVHPRFVNRGIGGLLLRAAENAAVKAGFRNLELTASLNAVDFYFRSGYKRIRASKVLIRGANLRVSCMIMKRRL